MPIYDATIYILPILINKHRDDQNQANLILFR